MLRITLFGEPSFTLADKPHPFDAPPRVLPLLAYLLLHRGTTLNRACLANTMWPDLPHDQARANLRRHLHYLKGALPGSRVPWLTLTSQTVAWNAASPYQLDVAEFELLSLTARGQGRAADLYRGDLFERCEDDWLAYDRERLRGLQIANLQHLAEQARASGAFDEAVHHSAAVLALDPWREDALRMLMIARVERGDRSGAIAAFSEFAKRLRAEMNIEPMPATLDLFDAISAHARPLPSTPTRLVVIAERRHAVRSR